MERFKRMSADYVAPERRSDPPMLPSPAQALLNRVEMGRAFGIDFAKCVFPKGGWQAHQAARDAYREALRAVEFEKYQTSEGT